MEEWKPVRGWEHLYAVSNLGNVRNIKRGRNLSISSDSGGYGIMSLYNKGKSLTQKAHRLVAIAFVPNPDNKPLVNHIDHDRRNNHYLNLEWSTPLENARHCVNAGRWPKGESHHRFGVRGSLHPSFGVTSTTARLVLDLNTGVFYNSVREASFYYGINYNTLHQYLHNRIKNKTSLIFC